MTAEQEIPRSSSSLGYIWHDSEATARSGQSRQASDLVGEILKAVPMLIISLILSGSKNALSSAYESNQYSSYSLQL